MLNRLIDLKHQLSAGAMSFSEKEWQKLLNDFKKTLQEILDRRELDKREFVIELSELLETVFKTELTANFVQHLDAQIFFKLGEQLLSLSADLSNESRTLIHLYLEMFRQPELLTRIDQTGPWEALILKLIKTSNYTLSPMLRQRAQLYPGKTLFGVIRGRHVLRYSFQTVRERVEQYARGLLSLLGQPPADQPSVAFFMENSLEMALLDLACLSSGLVNVMIPANSVSSQLAYILNQTKARVLVISGNKQLTRVNEVRRQLKYLEHIVIVHEQSSEAQIISLNELVQKGLAIGEEQLVQQREKIRIEDLATIMYTSGTTGEPKGIMFSHLNIVYKRFCRAMALPKIGRDDRFLAYLPLYHTFGRYLEMLGALFWTAEYFFMENPAVETMIRNMQLVRPTIFISIPKKWLQLYEYITATVDVEIEDEQVIRQTVEQTTGGALRWGLSAAGYLDPTVFRFFQQYGIELLSGFGMTEATGGITMTEPGNYVANALGKPLPGIEVKLAEDGELLIRGPYVMMGYYATKKQPFVDGWFPTGDIMRRLENGYLEIIDRKKEIYKNIRGETIAPQRIEKFFYDFEYVKQVFLIGDNRPFNTVLIYPNLEGEDNPLRTMDAQEMHAFFSSVVVTVNNFLAPFERIVDFRIIDRPFSAEKGELTPKGTYKRRAIERNFAEIIESMYQRNFVEFKWEGLSLRIPDWFLREKGYLTRDIQLAEKELTVPKAHLKLPMVAVGKQCIRIGDYLYRFENPIIDLQLVFSNPLYWIGNKGLIAFTGEQIFQWYRLDRVDPAFRLEKAADFQGLSDEENQLFDALLERREYSLKGIHLALLHLQSGVEAHIRKAIQFFSAVLDDPQHSFYHLVEAIVANPAFVRPVKALREQFKLGLRLFKGGAFSEYLAKFLVANKRFLNEALIAEIADQLDVDPEVLGSINGLIKEELNRLGPGQSVKTTTIPGLLHLLAQIGVSHPSYYKQTRQWIVRYQLRKDLKEMVETAREARHKLLRGFRQWIGENQKISIDVETGKEYRWQDVVIFEEGIPERDRQVLLRAINEKPIIREALFLLGGGILAGLYDIPPGGVWISHLYRDANHTVYRVSVQTRFQGGADFVINLEHGETSPAMLEEMNWLIHACAPAHGIQLVEEFGGYWREFNLWTEEYIPGDSLEAYFSKILRRKDPEAQTRLKILWPHFVWTGISAHVSFWHRTGYRLEIADKSPANIMIPPHDYLTGVRIFSIRHRLRSKNLASLVMNFWQQFVEPMENQYPFLKDDNVWYYIFSGILDAEGESEGLSKLRDMVDQARAQDWPEAVQEQLRTFLQKTEKEGFIPRSLYFAIQRFRRWFELNPDADLSAQMFTLNELYETYQLDRFERRYPEIRIRYFLETVFKDAHENMRQKLLNIIQTAKEQLVSHEERLRLFSEIRTQFALSETEEFFLSRLSYPHLQPEDAAGWLSASAANGVQQSDVVVTMEDYDGRRFHIRKPISPKEISRLHKIFLEANLPVVFKPEHRFLIAVSERGYVIGGLFYSIISKETVHMEKIVVTQKYRRKGISEGLMSEFFNRMRDAKFRFVTTGFFRPEYFYRFGFRIERKYAGLVKNLESNE